MNSGNQLKKNNPTVTIIGTLPPIIGISPYTKNLVAALSKRLTIYFLGFNHLYPKCLFPGQLYDHTYPSLSENENLKIKNTLNWYNPFQWIIEAFRIQTKIIHAQWWSYPLALLYFTILGVNKIRGRSIIMTIHNVLPHEKNFFKLFLNNIIFSLADEYIVHTHINKSQLAEYVPHKPIHVIPHGIIHSTRRGISKEIARIKLGLRNDQKALLCFGHIRDYKGIDVAIRALSLLNDKNIKLIIAGKCWDNWEKYQKIIDNLGLADRIILELDFIPTDDIEIFFQASDLALLPYKYFDAQSGIGALATAFQIPMIVSRVGGLPDYVDDSLCIIEPNDVKNLAKNILKILNNTVLYEKLKKNLEQKAFDLNWDRIAEQTEILVYQKYFQNRNHY